MAIPAGDGWPATDWFENIYLRTAGVDNYNKLTQHQIPWTDPSVVTALTDLGRLPQDARRRRTAVRRSSASPSPRRTCSARSRRRPCSTRVTSSRTDINKLGKFKVGDTAKFFNFPSINGSQPAVGQSGGDEAVALKNTPAAMALMAYLASPEAADDLGGEGRLPVRQHEARRCRPTRTTPPGRSPRRWCSRTSVVFDMSDQTPTAFGGQKSADEWNILTKFVGDPSNPQATAAALEAAAEEGLQVADGRRADRTGASGQAAPRPVSGGERARRETRVVGLRSSLPALIVLAVLVAWPIVQTIWLSFRDANGRHWVGLHNYATMFTDPQTRKAITNNLDLGGRRADRGHRRRPDLRGAHRADPVRDRVQDRPVRADGDLVPGRRRHLAAGLRREPGRGACSTRSSCRVHDTFAAAVALPGRPAARQHAAGRAPGASGAFQPPATAAAGTVGADAAGRRRRRTTCRPARRRPPRRRPAPGVNGIVWLDFTQGGGGTAGVVDPAEKGLPGVTVQAVHGRQGRGRRRRPADGTFALPELTGGGYTLRLPASNFAAAVRRRRLARPDLRHPVDHRLYLWVWAGFAMVLIAAGLAALPRETLEAARVDGATEWQVFRRVTVPLRRDRCWSSCW